MNRNSEIVIANECAPIIAAAIQELNICWRVNGTASKVFRLFEKTIEPAFQIYLRSLPFGQLLLAELPNESLSELAQDKGFRAAEDFIVKSYRQYGRITHTGFLATVDSLRNVIIKCAAHQPPSLASGLRNRPLRERCELCSNETEYFAYFAKQRDLNNHLNPEGRAPGLSNKYCHEHRPKLLSGKRNPEYLWADRHKYEFEEELERLTRRSSSMRRAHLLTELDSNLDAFYLNLLAFDAVTPGESSRLCHEARMLVDMGINDRKKRMVMLRTSGYTHAAIAKEMGVKSRQAISKALAEIPRKYRFDIKKNKDDYSTNLLRNRENNTCYQKSSPSLESSHDLFFNLLHADLRASLLDPDIVEIFLTSDGSLRVNNHADGLLEIGKISATESKHIIRAIAHTAEIEFDEAMSIIEANLPRLRFRFIAILPPIVSGPMFVITKMASNIYCPIFKIK